MVCPRCGTTNRLGARFCKQCGAMLGQPYVPAPPPTAQPPSPPFQPRVAAESGSGGAGRVIGGIGLFAGYVMAIAGGSIALGSFFLPWFDVGGAAYTGFETVSQALEGGSDRMLLVWGLVPLGALGVLLLGLLGVVMGLFGRRPSAGVSRVVLLPLLVALPGLCGCFPLSSPFLSPLVESSFDFSSLSGALVGLGYGFWGALGGLGIALVGVLVALIGGLIGRRRAA